MEIYLFNKILASNFITISILKFRFEFLERKKILFILFLFRPLSGESLNLFIIDKIYTTPTLFFFATTSLKVEDLIPDTPKEYHQRMFDRNGKETQVTLNLKIMKLSSTVRKFLFNY